MALGDIQIFKTEAQGIPVARTFQVASGTTTTILAGEPVAKTLGSAFVTALATTTDATKPVVATDFIVGIAASTSTETTTAAGTVDVYVDMPGTVYLIAPKTTTLWDTQDEYNALVGNEVLLDFVTSGNWTILSTDGGTSGCVIEDLDILLHPGRVAFSFRRGLNYLA
jgi:hypothetical protein